MKIKSLKKTKYNMKIWKYRDLSNILKKTILLVLVLIIINIVFQGNYEGIQQKRELKFNSKGEFKLVQFTDLHEHSSRNERSIKFMEDTLNSEKPDLVILTGDNIDARYCWFKKDVEKAISDIAKPMEDRKIPWVVVLGNHDSQFCKIDRKSQMKIYMSYQYNLSEDFSSVIGRSGDYNILIKDSKDTKPVFNIYLLDSGDYCVGGYGYIKKYQIDWYRRVSTNLKKDYGKTIPSLMFFHIPLQQQYKVWESEKAVGNRNEKECPQKVDTGLFSALIEMGDVRGVFVGHDHTNDYMGNINNITLGYGRCTGYGDYGNNGFARGARIFLINQNSPEEFKTYEKLE